MSSEPSQSNSQDYSSHHRNPDLSKDPALQHQFGYLSTPIESVQPPAFQQSALDNSDPAWPFITSPVPALETSSLPSSGFPFSSHPQSSTTPLHSNSLPESFYDPDSSYSEQSYSDSTYTKPTYSEHYPEQTIHQSIEQDNCQEQLPTEHPRGLGIIPYPMSVASDTYFGGQMQPNSHHYVWPNRPFQPLQPPSGNVYQQFPPPQSYPSSSFSAAYGSHPNGPMPGYHSESHAPSSYLPGAPGSARPSHSRSPSMARSFTPHTTTALPEQPIMTSSSPYMMNQPAYYLPEAPQIPSSHPSSMGSQASSAVADPIFSPPESLHGSDNERQVRVVSSRPRPQCWDHGCNGREFSTFSNLLRHQREKSGVVAKAECPVCGAVFTRTTARNIHVAQGKCKGGGREPSAE
ncbi:hypothetical protein N7507_000974 [Penicillium longicatenatum]|nr:hypothetical protein N7507_000974 [Penicillium longicatenatum]